MTVSVSSYRHSLCIANFTNFRHLRRANVSVKQHLELTSGIALVNCVRPSPELAEGLSCMPDLIRSLATKPVMTRHRPNKRGGGLLMRRNSRVPGHLGGRLDTTTYPSRGVGVGGEDDYVKYFTNINNTPRLIQTEEQRGKIGQVREARRDSGGRRRGGGDPSEQAI